jgi:hypothetical protein
MFPIYGTLIIVIIYRISLISHMNKNQHGIRAGLGLTPSREGPGCQKVVDTGQFVETWPEILPSCMSFLQSVGGSMVGVPLIARISYYSWECIGLSLNSARLDFI